jgi:hypothetical protein
VRKRDPIRSADRKATRAALSALVLLGACLNPRPEEEPSDLQLEPVPESAGASVPNASSSPGQAGGNADSPALESPATNPAPTRAPSVAPPEPRDAGAPDAGDPAASDAG